MPKRRTTNGRVVSQSEWEHASQLAKASQREVLCDVMLTAQRSGAWLTLRELARMTSYGEASISAQLRHLRKPQYGGFVLEKRLREEGENARGSGRGVVWEYQLRRGRRSRAPQHRKWLTRAALWGALRAAREIFRREGVSAAVAS